MLTDYDAIIFDMDGTLVDSLNVWVEADKRFLHSFGFEYDERVSYAMKTMHFAEACRYLTDTFSLSLTAEETEAAIMKSVKESYLRDVELKPFVREYLDAEREKGVKMCVATSNEKNLALALMNRLDVSDYFEFIITSDEVGSSKDDPGIFLTAAERLGSIPSRTLVFEDSVHAARSAASAGFCVIGVYDEYSAHEFDLLKDTAYAVIISFQDSLLG